MKIVQLAVPDGDAPSFRILCMQMARRIQVARKDDAEEEDDDADEDGLAQLPQPSDHVLAQLKAGDTVHQAGELPKTH